MQHPLIFAAALTVALAAVVIAAARAVALPRAARVLILCGLASLCLSAGGITWRHDSAGSVGVVVDLSPSTRGATYRDRAKLAERISQLLGSTPYTLYQMGDGISQQSMDDLPQEVWSAQTRFTPLPVDAMVLFSDGQFPRPPAAPRVYSVIDPALDAPPDAAIERLELRNDRLAATVRNTGPVRELKFGSAVPPTPPARGGGEGALLEPVAAPEPVAVAPGVFVQTAPVPGDAVEVAVTLDALDAWPENDSLRLRLPPPRTLQRWWVGRGAAPQGWVAFQPQQLPAGAARYLNAACIVLDNVAADDLDGDQHLRLEQYVRNLGGGVVILGGDRAFAAGGYPGSALERVSPLASTPPQPTTQWLLLADSSGSMAASIGDNTRLHFATDALLQIVPLLPASDSVAVGNFAEAVRWWIAPTPVHKLTHRITVPRELRPGGPTNLVAALRLIADTTDTSVPTQLLLITDAQTKIDHPEQLAAALIARRITVHVLTPGQTGENLPLRELVQRTGGRLIAQSDPRRWAAGTHQLLRQISPGQLGSGVLTVRFTAAGPEFPPLEVSSWNQTWFKPDAAELAIGEVSGLGDNLRTAAAAQWNLGSGAAVATAFATDPQLAQVLADRVATPPRDPRYQLSWEAGAELRVSLIATDEAGPINRLEPRIEFSRDASRSREPIPIPQVAPGRYELTLPAPTAATFAAVYVGGRCIERFTLAGRYPAEFNHIGNDRSALQALAEITGGAVIEPSRTHPIDFAWPTRLLSLSPHLAAAGAGLMAAGLLIWKWR